VAIWLHKGDGREDRVKRLEAGTLERGDVVLDIAAGELLEFLWVSGYDHERDQPFHVQLRPLIDRTDYSRSPTYSELLDRRYVRLT